MHVKFRSRIYLNIRCVINAWRACARGLQYFVCLFVCLHVCYQSPGFYSRLYMEIRHTCLFFASFFQDFQLSDFDKTVSFVFFGAFRGYFVVSSPYERFRILFVAITVTWSDKPACAVIFLPTQQVRSITDCEWRCRSGICIFRRRDWLARL